MYLLGMSSLVVIGQPANERNARKGSLVAFHFIFELIQPTSVG